MMAGWLAIIGAAVVTYGLRLGDLLMADHLPGSGPVKRIMDALPGRRLVKIHDPSKTIIVEDTPENIGRIEKIVAYWDQMPRQVLIEAKILEVSLTDDMEFGVDWAQILGNARIETKGFSDATLPTTGPVSPSPTDVLGGALFGNLISAAGTKHQFSMAIDALQEKTKVNTLSTPKILAIHGRAAKVQVGGQQGYKVTTTNVGVATESIEFIDTGTVLEITPYIDDNNQILLKVEPSITSADIEEGIPVTQTTFVSTWLMAENGETVFIGGLIRNTESKTREMIPCLGGAPGVGFLFGRTQTELDKSELVILITPTIIDTDTRQVSIEPAEKIKKAEEHFESKPLPTLKQMREFIKPVH